MQAASADSTQADSLVHKVAGLYKKGTITSIDTGWIRITKKILPGAKGGLSHGPIDYRYIDREVTNYVLYEYKMESHDFKNATEAFGPVFTMPKLFKPGVFRLGMNYPNPFLKQTTIMFELPVATKVSINIFNLQGQLVKRLVKPQEILQPSVYRVFWDGKNDRGRREWVRDHTVFK